MQCIEVLSDFALSFMFTVYFAIEFGALSVSALSARPGHFVNRQVNRDICPPKAAFYERPSAEHSALHLLPISTLSLLGLTMAILAASLRVYARATMGNLFRYEISIQKSHKLITSGPYAYVRHPGYTGGSLMCIGLLIFILSPGTFLSECLTTNPIVIFAKLYMGAFFAYMPIWTVFWRTEEEDKLLRKEFGAQWDEWARRTKYKVIPFVY